jgi:hypothetical protein
MTSFGTDSRWGTGTRRRGLVGLVLLAAGACGAPMPMTTDAAPPGPPLRMLTEAGGGVAMCPPGRIYRFSCSPTCGDGPRACANTPTIRVCDAGRTDMECLSGVPAAVLGEGSAGCGGVCTGVQVQCPSAGVVKLAGFNAPAGGVFLCEARGRDVGGVGG